MSGTGFVDGTFRGSQPLSYSRVVREVNATTPRYEDGWDSIILGNLVVIPKSPGKLIVRSEK